MSKSKKNFPDNPALRFINIPQEDTTAPAKHGSEQQNVELRAVIPEGYRLEKIRKKRTRRLQLAVEPSLYEKMRAAADAAGVSVSKLFTFVQNIKNAHLQVSIIL